MPFVKWSVDPVCLSKKRIWASRSPDGRDELTTTSNTTLVNALRQLASVVQIAHEIFTEISEECNQVYERADTLKKRLNDCQSVVEGLNAKTVKVPVGDLTKFSQLTTHYTSKQPWDVDPKRKEAFYFGPESRPPCVRNLYCNAAATPVHIIRTIDQYRQDGRTGSKIFMCMPVIGDQKTNEKCDMDIETRRPASVVVVRDQQNNSDIDTEGDASRDNQQPDSRKAHKITAPSMHSPRHDLVRLPSPEEQMHALSLEYPSSVVPIDITGSNFQRMSSVRRSLIHVDFFIRRKKKKKAKRRNTISEGSSKEIREALQDDLAKIGRANNKVEKVNNSCQTEVEVEVHRYCRFLPLRRSFHRKSVAMPDEENNNSTSNLDKGSKSKDDVSGLYESVDLKASKDWKPGRKAKKVEELGSGGTIKLKQETEVGKKSEKSSNKNKGRSYIPISTVSAAMTVAVKMRETMTRSSNKSGEDGRSSSGNWSAGSSNRASVDSDNQRVVVADSMDLIHSHSDSSLGKDSVISDNTQQDTDGRSQDGTLTGYTSDTSAAATAVTMPSRWRPSSLVARQVTAMDTDTWLQSLDQDTRSNTLTPDYLSDSASTPLVLSPYLYRRGVNGADTSHASMDDGESSVYSVDTDGYYTSMHTDSGLKSHSLKYNFSSARHLRRGSESSVGTLDNSSLNSILSRTGTEPSSNCSTLTKKEKVPPPPPPRISSAKSNISSKVSNVNATEQTSEVEKAPSRSHSPSPATTNGSTNGSTSESEHEVLERLRKKTEINSSRYPSMCAVSPVPSEDDVAKSEKLSERSPPNHLPSQNDAVSESSKDMTQNTANVNVVNASDTTKDRAPSSDSPADSYPPKINMYGDQSPQKSKFKLMTESPCHDRSKSGDPPCSERQLSVSSFSPTSHKEFVNGSYFSDDTISVADSQDSSNGKSSHYQAITPSSCTNSEAGRNSIPLKYTHHITITPKVRDKTVSPALPENKQCPNILTSPTHVQTFIQSTFHPNKPWSGMQNGGIGPSPVVSPVLPSSPIHMPPHPPEEQNVYLAQTDGNCTELPAPNTPPYLARPSALASHASASPNRPVARVTLDPEGRVIYMSNSLGRRRDGHPMNCTTPSSPTETSNKFATLPMCHPHGNAVIPPAISQPASPAKSVNEMPGYRRNANTYHEASDLQATAFDSSARSMQGATTPAYGNVSRTYATPSVPGGSYYCSIRQPIPNLQSTPQKPEYSNLGVLSRSGIPTYSRPQTPTVTTIPSTFASQLSPPPTYQMLNANRTVVPTNHTQRPHDLHLQSPSSCSSPPSRAATPLPMCSTPKRPSAAALLFQNGRRFEVNSIDEEQDAEDKKKPMTTEDLFAVIHNSKKKHNIKTDLEVTPSPHSSRSSSPCGRPLTPSRSVLAETGFLSPRNAQNLSARDRQSWAGDSSRPIINNVPGERKSLANDRLGPVKPTSMHDFKMLLLQARRTNSSPGDRRSAAELLRSTAPQTGYAPPYQMNGFNDVSCSLPCSSPGPQSLPTSPTKSLSSRDQSPSKSSWNGHSTVPLKRGVRARSTLQNRYDLMLYPPIMEEDLEASREMQRSPRVNPSQPLFVQNSKATGKENGYLVPSGLSRDRCSQSPVPANPPFPSSSTWV